MGHHSPWTHADTLIKDNNIIQVHSISMILICFILKFLNDKPNTLIFHITSCYHLLQIFLLLLSSLEYIFFFQNFYFLF